MRRVAVAVIAAVTVTAAAVGYHQAAAQQRIALAEMAQDSAQWVMPSQNYAATRHSALDEIKTSNVGALKVAWTMSTGATRGHEGQPLVIGDTLYFESAYPNHVYAVDLDDYHIKWQFTPKQDSFAVSVACCDLVNRGVGYGDGKIIVNALDGQVIALDINTGKPVWTVHNSDPAMGQTLTAAPLIVKEKNVIVGVSGGEFGVRGYLTAYDIKTGKRVWRAYSEGPDRDTMIGAGFSGPKNAGVSTWNGEQWKVGGGTTWGWFSYDPKLNSLYYGTGNPGTWNPTQRPGDNKWSMTIFARDADTGMAKWGYQMTPHDAWDYDGVNEMILVDLNMNGQTIPSLVHFDRNGFAYELDRRNGKLLMAKKFDPSVNWATHVDMTTGRPAVDPRYMTKAGVNVSGICPAAMGSKDQQPASYDEESGYFIVPTNHNCMDYKAFAVKYKSGFPFVGAIVKMYPGPGGYRGAVIAWDPIKGEIAWSNHERFPAWGGTLSTKGGVSFYGTMDGWFKAVESKTGKELWKFHTPSGIIGNPISYTHNGKQYVAILSGVGGWAALGMAAGLTEPTAGLGAVNAAQDLKNYTQLGGDLVVFSL
ncbi:MAG: lanthanide-dependent methanol dehydrogenase [Candidatus Eremiobacteraeota bacterium]|jgi:PQQ-dependent dehydrogenase (methanol/ethanol family)|nr:lanthanide-dependent methanol dehydrogenase [Candidatus Eremiobacteraeota bacterium]